jgi:O-acetyl-ADP-ribose deacetylase (regulator of RNase III)
MIIYKEGSVLSVTKGIIVHGCNTEGVMGAGVALQVKVKYPEAFKVYKSYISNFKKGEKDPIGTVNYHHQTPNLLIANAITQNLGEQASLKAIEECFTEIISYAKRAQREIHTVKIGCGFGKLEWNKVATMLEKFNYPIYVWELDYEK